MDYKLNSMDVRRARERWSRRRSSAWRHATRACWPRCAPCRAHLFVPAGSRERRPTTIAPLPIGEGQTISQPYMVAVMTAALALRADHACSRSARVRLPGGDPRRLARSVMTIERHPALADARRADRSPRSASRTSTSSSATAPTGYPAEAPYDRILVTAGAPRRPRAADSPACRRRPAGHSGRAAARYQHLIIIERAGATARRRRRASGCVFVPLIGRHGWPGRDLSSDTV